MAAEWLLSESTLGSECTRVCKCGFPVLVTVSACVDSRHVVYNRTARSRCTLRVLLEGCMQRIQCASVCSAWFLGFICGFHFVLLIFQHVMSVVKKFSWYDFSILSIYYYTYLKTTMGLSSQWYKLARTTFIIISTIICSTNVRFQRYCRLNFFFFFFWLCYKETRASW